MSQEKKPSSFGEEEYIDDDLAEENEEAFIDPADILHEEEIDEEELQRLQEQGLIQIEEGGEFDQEGGEEVVSESSENLAEVEEEIVDESIGTFAKHTDSIYQLKTLVQGANSFLVAAASGDDTASLWKVTKQASASSSSSSEPSAASTTTTTSDYKVENLHTLTGHKDSVIDIAFNGDGKFVATGSMDGTIGIWNVETGKLHKSLEGPSEAIEWIQWHPKGMIIIAGTSETTAWMWNANTGKCINVFAGHSQSVTCGGFTSDGKRILTGSEDSTVRVWDPVSTQTIHTFEGAMFAKSPIFSLASKPLDANIFLCGDEEGKAFVGHIDHKKVLATFSGHTGSVESCDFSTLTNIAATGGMDGNICIWDLNTTQGKNVLKHADGVIKVKFDNQQPLLYSCSSDKTVQVWDLRTATSIKTLRGHRDVVLGFEVVKLPGSSETLIVSGSDDHNALLFRM